MVNLRVTFFLLLVTVALSRCNGADDSWLRLEDVEQIENDATDSTDSADYTEEYYDAETTIGSNQEAIAESNVDGEKNAIMTKPKEPEPQTTTIKNKENTTLQINTTPTIQTTQSNDDSEEVTDAFEDVEDATVVVGNKVKTVKKKQKKKNVVKKNLNQTLTVTKENSSADVHVSKQVNKKPTTKARKHASTKHKLLTTMESTKRVNRVESMASTKGEDFGSTNGVQAATNGDEAPTEKQKVTQENSSVDVLVSKQVSKKPTTKARKHASTKHQLLSTMKSTKRVVESMASTKGEDFGSANGVQASINSDKAPTEKQKNEETTVPVLNGQQGKQALSILKNTVGVASLVQNLASTKLEFGVTTGIKDEVTTGNAGSNEEKLTTENATANGVDQPLTAEVKKNDNEGQMEASRQEPKKSEAAVTVNDVAKDFEMLREHGITAKPNQTFKCGRVEGFAMFYCKYDY